MREHLLDAPRPHAKAGRETRNAERIRGDGSPHEPTCTTTGSGKTARGASAYREIKPSDPVPLYLVPIAIAGEIRRLGGVISEVHVRRTGRHCYAIAVVTREEG